MSATILPFPLAARKRADLRPTAVAQPLGAGSAPPLSGAVSSWADANLEVAINQAHKELLAAKTADGQYHWWQIMKRLCCLRSAAQIERMEKARGLR